MFTPHFRKPLLALSAVSVVGLLFAGIFTGLMAVSTWAERDLHAFPFKGEDWLRYLLPTRFEAQDRARILLAGPSTVRENLRYDQFEAAFPEYDIYQGGISLGTLEDVTASLEYLEKVHGAGLLPEVIVLGIAPRFIANIPEDRPFSLGLNRYSPYYSAAHEPSGIVLSPKGRLDGALARARFLAAKQPERFRIGLMAVLNHWLFGGTRAGGAGSETALAIERLFKNPWFDKVVRLIGFSRALDFSFKEVLQWLISPYKYSLSPPRQFEPIRDEDYKPELDGWWGRVYTWDPQETEQETSAGMKEFVNFVTRHNIRLFVFNLPERDWSRVRFNETNYQAYLDLVARSFAGIEVVNFRDFLDRHEFFDREHSTVAGSMRLTDEIIRRMRAAGLESGALR